MAGDIFSGIAGHAAPLARLRTDLETGNLAHAYLFAGEPALGKTAVARRFAAALLPEAPLDRNPDYWEDDRAATLKVDEIRLTTDHPPEVHEQTLQSFLALKPALGERRVAVVAGVNRVQDQTQGVLLKMLEEPMPGRVVILTTPSLSPFVVLPTVVSRCRRVAFHALPASEVEQLLLGRGVDAGRAGELALHSRGRPGWAVTASADPELLDRMRGWERRLEEIFGGPADAALRLAAELDGAGAGWRAGDRAGDDPVQLALGSWQVMLRRRMADDPRPGRWARLVELSFDTVGHLEQNVSARLALEVFLLEAARAA